MIYSSSSLLQALYRRAQAKLLCGNHDDSLKDINMLLSRDKNNKAAQMFRQKAMAIKATYDSNQKKMYATMFG
eukprot:m.82315 g.82315  ORF g.82315 m.82315 type:complete len:73 (+) comp8665_c5_seq1:1284-1502(+)